MNRKRDVLIYSLNRTRRAILFSGVVGAFIRSLLLAMILANSYLVLAKIFHFPQNVVLLPIAIPIIAVARRLVKGFTIKETALLVDKTFNLDERISTALEMLSQNKISAFRDCQYHDALNSLSKIDVAELRHTPKGRELAYLVGSFIFVLAIYASPSLPKTNTPEEIANKIEATAEKISSTLPPNTKDTPPLPHELKSLISETQKALENILSKTKISPEEARDFLIRLKKLLGEISSVKKTLEAKGKLTSEQESRVSEIIKALTSGTSLLERQMKREGIIVEKPEELYEELSAKDSKSPFGEGDGSNINPSDSPKNIIDIAKKYASPQTTEEIIDTSSISNLITRKLATHRWDEKYNPIVKRYYKTVPK